MNVEAEPAAADRLRKLIGLGPFAGPDALNQAMQLIEEMTAGSHSPEVEREARLLAESLRDWFVERAELDSHLRHQRQELVRRITSLEWEMVSSKVR